MERGRIIGVDTDRAMIDFDGRTVRMAWDDLTKIHVDDAPRGGVENTNE